MAAPAKRSDEGRFALDPDPRYASTFTSIAGRRPAGRPAHQGAHVLILDPTAEASPTPTPLAPRLDTLRGKTVCLLDISKPKGASFLDALERRLVADYGVARVVRRTKPAFSRPAPPDLAEGIAAEADCVIEALAD